MKAKETKTVYRATRKCDDCPKRIKNDGNIYCPSCWFERAFAAGLKITITA